MTGAPRQAALDIRFGFSPELGRNAVTMTTGSGQPVGEWPEGSEESWRPGPRLASALADLERMEGETEGALTLDDDLCLRMLSRLEKVSLLLTGDLLCWGSGLSRFYDAASRATLGALDPSLPPRVVEVSVDEKFEYPVELLRLYPGDHDDLLSIARSMMGMSTIVRRRFRHTREPARTALASGPRPLPLSLFQHQGLAWPGSEYAYLKQVPHLAAVHGPWPGTGDAPASRHVVRHMLDPRIGVDRSDLAAAPSAVLHFACHCEVGDQGGQTGSDAYVLRLGQGADVVMADLKSTAYRNGDAPRGTPRPLVFLNTCGSSQSPHGGLGAFPAFFLAQGFRGVVGTLGGVSNQVASHFARVFYAALFSGRTVGESVYDARWHLMAVHNNPLGLLFTHHGDADARVEHPSRPADVLGPCDRWPTPCGPCRAGGPGTRPRTQPPAAAPTRLCTSCPAAMPTLGPSEEMLRAGAPSPGSV